MAESSLAARLATAHPMYTALAPDWNLYRASYIGGTTYTKGNYLFQHHREETADFLKREERAVYPNYSRKVVDIYNAFLFKDHATRTTDDPDLGAFLDDVDRRGTSMAQLMSEYGEKLASIYGHVVFLVDLPRVATDLTLYQEQEAGVRPYVTVYSPLEVLDWATDEDGAYTAIRFVEYAPPSADLFVKRTDDAKRYRTWTTTAWMLHDDKGNLLDEGTHDLGIVPAFRMDFRTSIDSQPVGESLLVDIAPLNRAIFNYRSLLDEFLYLQCFNILGIPYTKAMTSDQMDSVLAEFGTSRGLLYDGAAGAPSFIAPSPEPAKILLDAMLTASREITSIAKLQDRSSGESAKSGIAWAYEFHEANATFAKIAKTLEDAEQKIIALYYRWKGVKDATNAVIQYPSDFNVRTLREEIDETLGLLTLRVSDRFNKELRKAMVSRRFPALDPKAQAEILEQIDSAPPDDVLDREAAFRLDQEQTVPGQPQSMDTPHDPEDPEDSEDDDATEDAPVTS